MKDYQLRDSKTEAELLFGDEQIVQMNFIAFLFNFNDCGCSLKSHTVNCTYSRLTVKLQWMKCGNHDIEKELPGHNVHI